MVKQLRLKLKDDWVIRKLIYLCVFVVITCNASAQIPATLSYQGLLTDAAGAPITDGNQTILFNFYTVATGGAVSFSRGPISVSTFQGLFTVILGNGQGSNNAALPSTLGDTQYYLGLVANGQAELSPRVALTAVPYAFRAQTAEAVDGAAITTGTVPNARLSTHLQDLADGILTGSKVDGTTLTTVNATNITTGTLAIANGGTGAATAINARTSLGIVIGTNVQGYDADLDDLADGTLSGSKIGTGISAANVTTGTLPANVIPATAGVPVGTVVAFAGTTIPPGWLLCDGLPYNQSAYAALFGAIGTNWGGSGTQFRVPDLRGRFLRGKDNGTLNDPDAASRFALHTLGLTGDNVGSYQDQQLGNHTHGVGSYRAEISISDSNNPVMRRVNDLTPWQSNLTGDGGSGIPQSLRTDGAPIQGNSDLPNLASSETRPKNAYVNFIIKAQ